MANFNRGKKLKTILTLLSLVLVFWLVKITFITSAVVVDVVKDTVSQSLDAQSTVKTKQSVLGTPSTNTAQVDYANQRIIALAPHVVEMLFDIGVGSRIIATTEHSDFPEQALTIPRVGNYARLKIEKILALQPDLIIAWRTGNPSDDLERLQQLGLKIVYSDPVNLTDVATELRLFGELTGSRDIAEQKAKQFSDNLNQLKTTYQGKEDVSVFYELWSKPLTTIAQNAWPQQHLDVCGASNPFAELMTDYPQINIEQIIVADPQIIAQPMSAGEPNVDAIDWNKFKQVTAAKHQQLLKPNSDVLHRMSFRLLGELEKLCLDIDKSRQFYQELELKTQN